MRSIFMVLFTIALAVIVAGCVSNRSQQAQCPSVAILATAERAPLADTPLADTIVSLTGISANCTRRGNEEAWRVVIKLQGESNAPFEGRIPIFVALLDREGAVLNRQQYAVRIKEQAFTTELPPLIWHTRDGAQTPTYKNAAIFVGFVLDEAQLATNRADWQRALYPQE